MRAPLPVLEQVGGDSGWTVGSRQLSAYRSLAKSRNISLERVVEAAARDRLVDVVRLRDYGRERRIEERNLARLEHLYRIKSLHIKQSHPLL